MYIIMGSIGMNQIYHKMRQFFSGKRMVNMQTKVKLLHVGIITIHLLYTIVFGVERIMPLFYYNVAVTLLYLYNSIVSIQRERYWFIYVTSVIEVLTHAMFATLLLGWNWGFAMYCMALIPAIFYFSYILKLLKDRLYIPIVSSAFVGSFFIILRAIVGKINPLYPRTDLADLQIVIYYFNIMMSFGLLVFFSSLFAMEINYMQQKLEQENVRLGKIANYDPLTQMMNRRSMNIQLKAAHDAVEINGKLFCVMLIDLDDFKKVNDTYGHDCGDEVLISVANVIMRDVREEDFVCRWGGEEILVLLKADLEIARKVAERICQDVRVTVVPHKDIDVKITLTIGIAEYKKKQTVRAMIEEADRNMYYGKQHGKNQVVTSYDRLED